MLTYQDRGRTFVLAKENELSFPSNTLIKIVFYPLQPFGSGSDEGKTLVKGVAAITSFNANTGRYSVKSKIPLSPLNVNIIDEGGPKIELSGNILLVSLIINDLNELEILNQSLFYLLPMLLNIEFVDPPYVKRIFGKIGDLDFNWELSKNNFGMFLETTTQEIQEQKFATSWDRYKIFCNIKGHRLVAAMHYFHVACRLKSVGNSPWEFMAEILLNYCKILEVLFPSKGESKSMETTRRELEKLGFVNEEIEKYFIPAIIIRNKIDVGHVDLSTYERKHLQILQSYADVTEKHFRELLKKVFDKLKDKSYCIPEYTKLNPRPETIKIIEKIGKNLKT